MKFYKALFIVIFVCSCNHEKSPPWKIQGKHNIHRKTKQDTLVVTTKSAVFADLDTLTLEIKRQKNGDKLFYAGSDDYVYYSSIADSVLRSKHLLIIYNGSHHYLKFVQFNGLTTIIRIDTLSQVSNCFLFDPKKAPINVDLTDIDNEFRKFLR